MILDFRRIDQTSIEADLCIVGAGAAGITLARALAPRGVRVCLLESGGLDYDADTQALYDGIDTGFRDVYNLKISRLRYFGGSTNHWVGHCTPPTATDFARRPWVRYSGWPIARESLDPYYVAAQDWLEIGAYRYDLREFSDRYAALAAFDPAKIVPRVWRLSPPVRFGIKYRADLERAPDVRVYLHANATAFECDPFARRVTHVRLRTLEGKQGEARAKYFVLAAGGIENARLLLASNRVAPAGLANAHDVVGRYYIDQLRIEDAGLAAVSDDNALAPLLGDFRRGGVRFESMLCPTADLQRRDAALDWTVELSPLPDSHAWAVALRSLREAWRAGKRPDDLERQIWAVLSDLDGMALGLYKRLQPRPLALLTRCEVAPDPNNRITLTRERDALGMPKVERHWRPGAQEKHTVRAAVQAIGEEFGRLGIGRVRLPDWLRHDDGTWPDNVIAGPHHMGTTRMASDPRYGVVDENCRVHGMENFYVAGSSVFPACGYAHPTLTIVALTLRLADHLRTLFA